MRAQSRSTGRPQHRREEEKGKRVMIKRNKLTLFVLGGMVVLGAGSIRAQAQEGPGGPDARPDIRPDAMMPGGPMGGRMEILGFGEMHPGAVVAGAPYT